MDKKRYRKDKRNKYIDPRLHVPDVLHRYLQIKAADAEEEKTILRLEKQTPVISKLKTEREAFQIKLKEIALRYHQVNNHQFKQLADIASNTLLNINLTDLSFVADVEEAGSVLQDEETNESDLETDTIFKKIVHNFASFMVWKVTNETLEHVPNIYFNNTFYTEACYLIYVASEIGGAASPDMIPRKIKKKLMQIHIHYWIGCDAQQIDTTFVAYKAIELCNYLKNTASIHRESQLHETPRFKGYFRNSGVRIFKGVFVNLTSTFTNRPSLYRLTGHGTTTILECDVSWKHFNSSEVFILLAKNILFVWFGGNSSMIEKLNGIRMANLIEDEAEDTSMCFVDDGREQALNDNEKIIFHEALNFDYREVAPFKDVEKECIAEKLNAPAIKVYTCVQTQGAARYKFTEYATSPLHYNILRRRSIYLFDQAPKQIWMWCGSNVFFDERDDALRNARGFIKKKNYPDTMPVSVVHENFEYEEFKLLFYIWNKSSEAVNLDLSVLNSDMLLERPYVAADLQLIDSGYGKLKIYRVYKDKLIETPIWKNNYVFFSHNCYLMFYFYKFNGEQCVIYFWMGTDSSLIDQRVGKTSMYEKDAELKHGCLLVKIHQGYEPPHFLQMFQGKFTVFNHYYTEFDLNKSAAAVPRKYLLEISGTISYNAKAIQIPIDPSRLNSNKCFVLRASQFFVWCGRHTTGDEREVAKNFTLNEYKLVFEGFEANDFWAELGERKLYDQITKISEEKSIHIPSVYHCYCVNKTILCERIMFYDQSIFSSYNIVLLDYITVLYIWIGENISLHDQKFLKDLSLEYLKNDLKGRNNKICIITVKQKHEPLMFQGFFEKWDNTFWERQVSYITLRQELEYTQEELSRRKSFIYALDNEEEFDTYPKYTLQVLIGPAETIPKEVNLEEKEMYLTVDDFRSVFNMEYSAFALLPKWKQEILKKLKGLF